MALSPPGPRCDRDFWIRGPARADHQPDGKRRDELARTAGESLPGHACPGSYLRWPGAGRARQRLGDRRHAAARLLQSRPPDGERAGGPRRNRPVDHDRGPARGRLLPPGDGGGPDHRPRQSANRADSSRDCQHRGRPVTGASARDLTAPSGLDRCGRGGTHALACPGGQDRAATAHRRHPRDCRRDRSPGRAARLAGRADPRRRCARPGRAPDSGRAEFLAVPVALVLYRVTRRPVRLPTCGRAAAR